MSNCKKVKKDVLLINILIPLLVGGIAALITRNSMDFYKTINVPSFAPPGYLFPIVWTVLYILMGVSSYLIYMSGANGTKEALYMYAIQLGMNFLWFIIFFNFRAFGFAFVWIILLWIAIILMIERFSKINKVAAWLQVPYLLWMTFAAVLNFSITMLNK